MDETNKTNFSLSKEGEFFKPSLRDYNRAKKNGIYYNRQQIEEITRHTKSKINKLQQEIKDLRTFRDSQINIQRSRIEEKKKGLTQEEFDKIAIDTEKDLREFVKTHSEVQ